MTTANRKIGLSQEMLKGIACLAMLADHIDLLGSGESVLRIVGRLAFPIYCFLLVEGVFCTKSLKKYFLRLGLMLLLSELPFDLMCVGQWSWSRQSVMVTLLLGCVMVAYLPKIPGITGQTALIALCVLLADLFRGDYGGWGSLMIAVFALTRGKPNCVCWQAGGLALIGWMMGGPVVKLYGVQVPSQIFAALAIFPIGLYSGKKHTSAPWVQWAFYGFYPAHLMLLWLLK